LAFDIFGSTYGFDHLSAGYAYTPEGGKANAGFYSSGKNYGAFLWQADEKDFEEY
jgi:hypothetical protein